MNAKNGAYAPTGSACLEKVLGRLDKVKQTAADKWKACCPAHDDKDPSLSVRELPDGRVLIHCWAGCSTQDVMAAIGLEMRDLFPGDKKPRQGPSRAAILHEQFIYRIGLDTLRRGEKLNEADRQRFELARERLGVRHG